VSVGCVTTTSEIRLNQLQKVEKKQHLKEHQLSWKWHRWWSKKKKKKKEKMNE